MANGWTGDFNQLFSQMNPVSTIGNQLNSWLTNGYGNYGNQIQGAMDQMLAVNLANQQASLMKNQTNAQYQAAREAARAPIEVEQMRQTGQTNRIQQLSPLLSQLFSGINGGGSSGGLTGFTAQDANGTPFAQATLGGSDAQRTPTNRYRNTSRIRS